MSKIGSAKVAEVAPPALNPITGFTLRIHPNEPIDIYNPKTGKAGKRTPTHAHFYVSKDGLALGYILRFDVLDKASGKVKKTFSPAQVYIDEAGKERVFAQAFATPRPLYNLQYLAPDITVILVEGEKTADMLAAALPECAVLTWPGGAGAVKHSDLSALIEHAGTIILWPDADKSGIEAMQYVSKVLGEFEKPHALIDINGHDGGFDAGDLIESGGDPQAFISSRARKVKLPPKNLLMLADDNDVDRFGWVNEVEWVGGNDVVLVNNQYPVHIDRRSTHNSAVMLRNHPDAVHTFVYDIFQDDIFLIKQPPWHPKNKEFSAHAMRDDDFAHIRMWLETKGFKAARNDVQDIVSIIAHENTINPPRDYFETLVWDGKERLAKWLTYYLGCETEDPVYLSAVGTKWLVGAVSRIYQPGVKFDTCLFLEGKQNIGKSLCLAELATFNGKRYFTDQHIEFSNKDSLLILQGKIICEMAELVSFRRAENNEIKAFITRQSDMYRPPYARSTIERPRMFVLAGTHNPDGNAIFTDTTGNRRYWPVTCGAKIDIEAIRKDREQLWAEAVHLYKQGAITWLTDEENAHASIVQGDRMNEDILSIDVQKAIDEFISVGTVDFTTSQIMDKLRIPPERKSNVVASRIKNVLTLLGYIEVRTRDLDKGRFRRWVKNIYFV